MFSTIPNANAAVESGKKAGSLARDTAIGFGVVRTVQRMRETVNTAIAQSLDAPKVRQVLMSAGAESAAGSPDALARFLQAEMAKWAKVVKAAGITIE